MGEKHEITHTQTFFPESLIHNEIRQVSWLASYCLPSHRKILDSGL